MGRAKSSAKIKRKKIVWIALKRLLEKLKRGKFWKLITREKKHILDELNKIEVEIKIEIKAAKKMEKLKLTSELN